MNLQQITAELQALDPKNPGAWPLYVRLTAVFDAAHNPEGAAALAAFLDGPFDLLFGALGDKDVSEMLRPLAERAHRIVLTTPASDRARSPEELADLVPGRDVEIVPDLGQALEKALHPGVRLVVCGSIYLIGEVRKKLRERYGVPPPASGPLY